MKTSEKLDQLLPALAKARINFGEIKKSKMNPHFNKPYAALDDILPAIETALAQEGLLLLGGLDRSGEGLVTVTTRLMHTSEQWYESTVDLSYQFGNLQKLGGEVTYARRYSINTMLQLSADEDLDDQKAPDAGTARVRKTAAAQKVPEASRTPRAEPGGAPPPQTVGETGDGGASSGQEVKLTTPDIVRLLTHMRECYDDEGLVDQAIRRMLHIPVPQPWSAVRLRLTMTRAQYDQLYQDATAYATSTIAQGPDDDDVPLTAGPDTPPLPQDAQTGVVESRDSSEAPASPSEDASMIPSHVDPSQDIDGNGSPGTQDAQTDAEPSQETPVGQESRQELQGTKNQWWDLSKRARAAKMSDATYEALRVQGYSAALDAIDAIEEAHAATQRELV